MKLMIASDLHGSAKYCRLLLDALNRENPDKLLLLGDLLYHGPRNDLPEEYAPKQVIAMLSGVKDKVLCVRGNCDTEVDQMVLPFPILADYCWLYLDGHAVFATHGHHHCEAQPPALQPGDILLLCSDGLSNMLEDDEIFEIVNRDEEIARRAGELINRANTYGGKDNISVVLVEPFEDEVDIC